MHGKQWIAVILVLGFILIGWQCGWAPDEASEKEEDPIDPQPDEAPAATVSVAAWGQVSLEHHPLLDWPAQAENPVTGWVFGTWLRQGRDFRMQPNLVSVSWDAERKVLTAALEPDAVWHDGEPVTADDLALGLEMLLHPEFSGRDPSPVFDAIEGVADYRQGEADAISGLEVLDRETLTLSLGEPKPAVVWYLARLSPLPSHRLQEVGPEHLAEYLRTNDPMGAGPYRWTRKNATETGTNLRLERREQSSAKLEVIDYWLLRDRPNFDETSDVYDVFVGPVGGRLSQDEIPSTHQRVGLVGPGLEYLGFDLNNPLFADDQVRKAVAWAIDEREIAHELAGEVHEWTGLFAIGSGEGEARPGYDPEKARALLQEQEYEMDPDARYYLLFPKGDGRRERAAQMISDDLKAIDLEVIPLSVERDPFLYTIFGRNRFDLYLFGMSWSDFFDQTTWGTDNPWGYEGRASQNESLTLEVFFDAETWREAVAALGYLRDEKPVHFLYHPRRSIVVPEGWQDEMSWQFPILGDLPYFYEIFDEGS